MTSQRLSRTYGKQLEIFAEFQNGKSVDELTSTFDETRYAIQSVLNRQTRLEQIETKKFKCSHLSRADKLVELHEHKIGTKPVDIQSKFKISPRTYYRIIARKDKQRERD